MAEISEYDKYNNPGLADTGPIKPKKEEVNKYEAFRQKQAAVGTQNVIEGRSMQEYTPTGIMSEGDNYGQVALGQDLNETRAHMQSTTENMFSSLAKAGGLMATTMASLVTTLPEGIVRATAGAFDPNMSGSEALSKLYDNTSATFLDKINKGADEMFPVYRPESYEKESLLQNMGTSQFWGETVLKNAGFTAGAMIGGGVVAKGLGAIAKITLSARAAELIPAFNALVKGGELPFEAARKVGSMIPYAMDKATQVATGAIVSFGESSMEAKQVKDELQEQLINKWKAQQMLANPSYKGEEPTGQALSTITNQSSSAGNVTMAANMAVLTGLDTFQFGRLWTKGFKEEVDRVGKIAVKDGVSSAVENSFGKKAAKYVGAYGKNTFSEAAEEGIQTAVQAGTKDYYSRKYDKNGIASTNDAIMSVLTGMQETFGTKGGLESMLAGAITGIGSHAVTSAISKMANSKNPSEFEAATLLADRLNKAGDRMKPHLDSMIRQHSIVKEKEENAASPNPSRKKHEDLNAQEFRAFVQPYIETGSFDLLKDKLNQEYAKDEDRFKLDNGENATRKSGKEFVAKLMQDAKKLKESWDDMQDVMPSTHPVIRQALWSLAADIDNRNERFNSLNTEVFSKTGVNYTGQSKEDYLAAIAQVTPDAVIGEKAGDIADLFTDKQTLMETYKKLQDPTAQQAAVDADAEAEKNKNATVIPPTVVKTEDELVKEKFDSDLRQLGVDLKTIPRDEARAKIQNTFDTSTDPVEKRVASQLLVALDRGDAKTAKDKVEKEYNDFTKAIDDTISGDKKNNRPLQETIDALKMVHKTLQPNQNRERGYILDKLKELEVANTAVNAPSKEAIDIYNTVVEDWADTLKTAGKDKTLEALRAELEANKDNEDVVAAIKLMIAEIEAGRPLVILETEKPDFGPNPDVVKLLETYFTLSTDGTINASKLFEFMEKFGTSTQKELLARLLEVLGDVNVGLMDEAMAAKYPTGAAYTIKGGKPIILFNLAYLEESPDVSQLQDYLSKVINHELLHYLTVDKLDESGEFYAAISAHLKLAQAAAKKQGLSGIAIEYGLQNEHEYLAEAFSNPEFQKFLDSIESQTPGVSLWEKFIELLVKGLGLNVSTSLLGDTIAVVSSEFGIAPVVNNGAGVFAKIINNKIFPTNGNTKGYYEHLTPLTDEQLTLEILAKFPILGNKPYMEVSGRLAVIAKVSEGVYMPFYQSSGESGDKKAGQWYPFFEFKDGYILKYQPNGVDMSAYPGYHVNNYYKSKALEKVAKFLDSQDIKKEDVKASDILPYQSRTAKGQQITEFLRNKIIKIDEVTPKFGEYVKPPSIADDESVQESTESERMASGLLRTSANHDEAIKNGLNSVLRYQNFVNNPDANFSGLKFRVVTITDPLYKKLQNKTQAAWQSKPENATTPGIMLVVVNASGELAIADVSGAITGYVKPENLSYAIDAEDQGVLVTTAVKTTNRKLSGHDAVSYVHFARLKGIETDTAEKDALDESTELGAAWKEHVDELNTAREGMLNGTIKELTITGKSSGIYVTTKAFNEVGSVLGNIALLDIRIPTVEDADNPGFVRVSDGLDISQDLRVGKAYVIKNGKLYPLQARKLADDEINNILKMFTLITNFPERKAYFLSKIEELVHFKATELEDILSGKMIEGKLAYLLTNKYRQVDATKLQENKAGKYGVTSVTADGVEDGVEQTYREFVFAGENRALGINMNSHPTAAPAKDSKPGDKNYPNYLNGYLQYKVKPAEGKPVVIDSTSNVVSITDLSTNTNTKPLSDAELIAENRRKQTELRKKKGNTGKIVSSPPINRRAPTLFSPPINTFQRVIPGQAHQQTMTIIDSVNGHFFNRLFEHGHTPDELLGTKGVKLIAGIYGLVYDDLYENYLTEEENFLTKLHTPETWKAIKQHYQLMLNMNEKDEPQSLHTDVVAVHRTFLKGLGITIGTVTKDEANKDNDDTDTKDDTDDTKLTGEETGRSKADYTNSNEESSINSAPNSIKLLVMSLPQVDKEGNNVYNEIGGPKLNDYMQTMKLLYANLNGLSQFHEMYAKLEALAPRFPVFKELVERLGAPGSNKELTQFLLETDFRQAFAKFESKGTITLINPETGAIYQVDANANKLKDRIKENWISNLRILAKDPKSYIKFGDDNIVFIDPRFVEDVRAGKFKGNYKGLLASIGIKFTDLNQEQVQALPKIQDDVNGLFKSLAAEVKDGKVLNNLWDKKADAAGRLDSLLDHEVPLSRETVELSYISAENKRIYAVSLNNFYSLSVSALNNAKSLEQLYRDYPHFKNPYTTSSYWMSRLFDEKGQKIPGTSIQMNTVSGLKIEGDNESGTSATKLEPADKIAQEINDLLGNGFASLIRAADKSTEYAFGLVTTGEKLAVPLKLVQEEGLQNSKVIDIFLGYFKDELGRIRSFKKGVGARIQIYQGQADKFSLFADILTPATLKKLEAYKTNEDELSPDLEAKIANETLAYLNTYAQDLKKYMAERKIGIKYKKGFTGFHPDFTGKTEKGLDAAIQTFSVNHLINMVEQSKLLVGDSAFYKDKFKRVAAGTGTKKFAANDTHTNNWLNRFYNNIFNRVDKKVANGRVNVVVFADNKVFQSNIEEYMTAVEAVFGIEKARKILEAYAKWDAEEKKWLPNMEEGDAQGWITLDEYREFMIRTGGAYWTEQHENQYRYEIALEKGEASDMENPGFFFMPIKAQYFGPQVMDGIYAPTFHKYSLAPIYHSLVKGRNMENLLTNMREKKIGYAVFGSGVKLGAPLNEEGKLQEFYDEEGVKNFSDKTPVQQIHYEFLGVQLDIAAKQKEKVIFGSQFRKLLFSNLFGDNTKDWAKKLSAEYNKVIDDLVQYEMIKLTKKLGLAYNEKGELSFTADNGIVKGDFRKLVETLRESLEDKDTADNILDSLQVDDKGQLIYPIDSMVNRSKIESMLFSIVNSKVIKQKMAGDGLVQLASTGFEPKGKRTVGTSNYLKFYEKGKDGKTTAMEVEVPMMKTFEPLLKMYGTIDKLNDAIAAGKVDPKMLTMIGYRIPTQGLNSIDHMTIKRFLPSTAGNALILPTGVVAKSGGDYDIDKLNVFRPQMYFDEESGKVVLYDIKKLDKEGKPKKEGMQNRIVEIAAEILSHEDNFVDLITPNTTDTLVELVGDIREARGESRGVVKASATKEFRFDTIMEQFTYFLGGKSGVGIGAVHNTHHILSQMAKVILNVSLPFKSNTVSTTNKVMKPNVDGDMELQDEVTSKLDLSQQYTQGGQKISDLISQFINAYVDVAKDPFYKDLNAGTDTAAVWFYLMRAGVDVKTIGYFMTQPIILDYVNARKLNKSLVVTGAGLNKYDQLLSKAAREKAEADVALYSGEGPFIDVNTEQRLTKTEVAEKLKKAQAKVNGSIYNDALASYGLKERVGAGDFSQEGINDKMLGWLKEGKSPIKSQEFRTAQTQMLQIFMDLETQARGLTELMADTNNDTNKLQNYGSIEQRKDIANKVAANTGLIPAGTSARIKKATIVGSFDLTEKIGRMFKELTLYSRNPAIKAGLRTLFAGIDKKADFAKEYTKIQNDFIGYVLQKFGKAADGKSMYTKMSLLADQLSQVGTSVTTKKGMFSVTPIQTVDKKASIKASIATQYIGFADGIANSSTDHYRIQAGEFANTGEYSAKDTIFVSIGGNRGSEKTRTEQQTRTIKEALKAIEAGATLITDNKFYIESSDYNSGEKRLAANLKAKGYNYAETVVDNQLLGVWTKVKNTTSTPSLAKQLMQMRREGLLTDNPFVNELVAQISGDTKAADTVKMYTRRMSAFESNVYTEAFRELINSTDERLSEFGKNLAYLTILQSGLHNSPITFTELIPFEFYGNIVKGAISIAENEVDMADFTKKYNFKKGSPDYRIQNFGITNNVPQDSVERRAEDKLLPRQGDSVVSIGNESNTTSIQQDSTTEKPFPGVETIKESGLSVEDSNKFIDLLLAQIQKQAYVQNKARTANSMFSFGLRWASHIPNSGEQSVQGKNLGQPRPGRVAINSKESDKYGYYATDQNNKPLPNVRELQPIIDFIQSQLGINMSNYDSVLGNIYDATSFIHQHRDTTESVTAEKYPIIVINLGADGRLVFDTNTTNAYPDFKAAGELPLSNGSVYAFGINGENRFAFHHRIHSGLDSVTPTKPITLPNGQVLSDYRITLTFRRAQDITGNIPSQPNRVATYTPTDEIEELNEKQQLKPLISQAGERVDVDTGEVFNVDASDKRIEKSQSTVDTFQYFGGWYTIEVDSNGEAVKVLTFKGEVFKGNGTKQLLAYNTNKNVDPQNGKAFRGEVSQPTFDILSGKELSDKLLSIIDTNGGKLSFFAKTAKAIVDISGSFIGNLTKVLGTTIKESETSATSAEVSYIEVSSYNDKKKIFLSKYSNNTDGVYTVKEADYYNQSKSENVKQVFITQEAATLIQETLDKNRELQKAKNEYERLERVKANATKPLTANQQLQLANNALIEKAQATSNAKRNAENAAKKEASKYELFPGVFANDGQKLAIDKIDSFLKDNKSPAFLLKGRGGTGKTTIIKKALASAKGRLLGATVADEARGVLAKAFPGLQTNTIASLIGSVVERVGSETVFRLKNAEELEKYYMDMAGEGAKIDPIDTIGQGGILIIDEASMIDRETYFHIMLRAEHNGVKVIFMGDNVQIQPIGESNSPVFDLLNTSNHAVLTERMRQGAESPILPITDLLAENVEAIERGEKGVKNPMTGNRVTNFNENTNEGVIFTQSQADFLDKYVKDYKNPNKTTVAIAYTNAIVNIMNLNIRKRLFGTSAQPFEVGEIVRLNSIWSKQNKQGKTEVIATNGFKGRVKAVALKSKIKGLQLYELDVEYMSVNEKTGKDEMKIKKLTTVAVEDKAKLKTVLNEVANDAKASKNWSEFWYIKDSIADVNYGYAITANKVQGSTYDNAYVNEKDIMNNRDSLDAQKKLYTAVSRPRTKLVIFNSEVAVDQVSAPVRQAPKIGANRRQAREINNLDNKSIEEGLVDKTCKL